MLLGLVLMTDAKATDKVEHPFQAIEKLTLKSPDAHAVQNANGQEFQAALKANLDRHSGSAGGNDAESVQIHMGDGRIASRLSAVTENQLLEPESIKNARSISLNELVEKQEKEKDPIARSLVGEFEQLLAMRNGPTKKAVEEKLQDKADQAYGRGHYFLHERPASQAVEPMPPILDSLKQSPHDSDTKLNIQITPVPEVSKPMVGEDVVQYFSHTMQAGADTSRESTMQVIDHYAHPDVVNGDLLKAGAALYNLDFLKVADFAMQAAAKIGEQIDQPLTPEQRSQMTGSMLPFFTVGGKPLDSKAAKAMNLEKLTDEELKARGIERKIEQAASKPHEIPELTPEQKAVFQDSEKGSMLVNDGGLKAHEGIDGAHTIRKHVGWTDEQLIERAPRLVEAASSFTDQATAERACAEAIDSNRDKLEAFRKSPSNRPLELEYNCEFQTGRLVPKDTLLPENVKGVKVILFKSSELPSGYRIHTSFPIREVQP
jgi:hypothetical protein